MQKCISNKIHVFYNIIYRSHNMNLIFNYDISVAQMRMNYKFVITVELKGKI
jgi:hypothetical protein